MLGSRQFCRIVGTRSTRAPLLAFSTSMMAEIIASCSVGASRSKKPRTMPYGSTENAVVAAGNHCGCAGQPSTRALPDHLLRRQYGHTDLPTREESTVTVAVCKVTGQDLTEVSETLAEAFFADPIFSW